VDKYAIFPNTEAVESAVMPSGLGIYPVPIAIDGRVAVIYNFVQMDIDYLISLGNVWLGDNFPPDWEEPPIEP